jgi:hypothetical protein
MKTERVPTYCFECGRELHTKEKTIRFDDYTGQRILRVYKYCPSLIYTHANWYYNESSWLRSMGND